MIIEECSSSECIEIVDNLIGNSMGWWHAYYATSCLKAGVCKVIVAKEHGNGIGVGLFYSLESIGVGVIYYVAVDEGYRGLGIGKAIVLSIEEILSREGIDIFLATTTEENIPSIKMFRDLGYEVLYLYSFDVNHGYRISETIQKLTCSYEDDLLLVKVENVNKVVDYLINIFKTSRARRIAEKIWYRICYSPWRRLRGY